MIINLKSQMQNTSLQVGDIAYFSTSVENVGIGQVAGEPQKIGPIINIGVNENNISFIEVEDDAAVNAPSANDFLMFSKDARINTSGLKGYFADVTLVNDSFGKVELFAISSEVSESSK